MLLAAALNDLRNLEKQRLARNKRSCTYHLGGITAMKRAANRKADQRGMRRQSVDGRRGIGARLNTRKHGKVQGEQTKGTEQTGAASLGRGVMTSGPGKGAASVTVRRVTARRASTG